MAGQASGQHAGAQGDAQVRVEVLTWRQTGFFLQEPGDEWRARSTTDQQDIVHLVGSLTGVG